MAVERKDRVKDQTSTTGTGTITLDLVAPAGYRPLSTHSTGASVNYLIIDATSTNWEVGQGVWTAGSQTLTRATVFASSNANALVNFGVGVKTVATLPTAADFAGTDYGIKTSNYSAIAGDYIAADTSAGSFTITLPVSPATGATVQIIDFKGTFGTNALTVARNGKNIQGLAEDLFVSNSGASFGLYYNGIEWRII